jgi:hypothetical protein
MKKINRGELIKQLREIRNIATMKDARFHIGDEPFPFGAECTDLIRAATRLWRDSWIVGPLDELIKELESAAD